MTTKQLDLSFDAMSLRDNALASPIDRRYSQYGSERAPSSPVTRKPVTGSQRNSVRADGKDMRRQSNRLSLANVNWNHTQGSPIQSPLFQDSRQQQQQQFNAYGVQQPSYAQQQQSQQQSQQQPTEEPVDTIPTAIVIKNIPFSVKRDALLAILDNLDIPKPYAFNYHFDNGVFRGLAFANYRTAEETELVVNAVNGLDVSGRKLRVEFKKVMPAAEQEKREQEKAAEALHRREMELMEAQLLEQERREQERRELEHQNREFERDRRNRSSALLDRQSSGRGLDRDEVDTRYSSSANQLDLNDPETLAFYDRLLVFRGDSTKDDMIFPENLSGRQRRILHLIADKLSLHHFSEGEGNMRRLIIMKNPPPYMLLEAPAPRSPKQRPMSYAGRGSLRSESPVLKTKSSLTESTAGSASPTRSPYRKSMILNPEATANVIYPIRQPKGPEPGKVFTIRERKQLRDAVMITPAFDAHPQLNRSLSGRTMTLDVNAPSFKPTNF
ncbi:hypothetical protein BX616_009386 [Lobosporangium transversale]|uniref:R3H domain-containing protein n=1 Tax=Lobosporangium transversale TaxID=64571 RepID=A0A1Y2GF80_9FUNG|nr:hypothetical protein BCR41DRAFT_358888 [Lobosporangium transversale]KAF9913885.1 hypothetical protein BX616_009386 [Lobosporangium transversale]ORZ09106.1 hypothetical protein BCR41DRAFT_358888 [Lobosporangium transversale]|eukprot:XP_021878733.1 hypothetical protein BCR41DRAFT_358888 [Lobosporangium transversale]